MQQLAECRQAYDAQLPRASGAEGADSAPYDISQHARYMISSFRARHPDMRVRRMGGATSLSIDRNDVVNSTVRCIMVAFGTRRHT
jgi:hypothetical protein